MLHAVVMAGGSGTRFWPASREAYPKQFLKLAGEETMLQATVSRIRSWIDAERIWIVTGASHAEQTARELPEILPTRLLKEPCPRNTAPCIGLAAVQLLHQDPEATMLVMPADHVIQPASEFQAAIQRGATFIEERPDSLLLFGIPPTFPATGFGYIERAESLDEAEAGLFQVASFREKPDRATAQQYVDSGRFYWNCGIFLWRARTILDALKAFEPEVHRRLERLQETIGTDDWQAALEEEFPPMKSISIDYAVLEGAKNVCVLEASFEWDDVGSWRALPRLRGTDENDNTVDGLFYGLTTQRCIIRSDGDHLIATVGMEDCIIVHTRDATLVARKDDENAIKKLVAQLKEAGYERFL